MNKSKKIVQEEDKESKYFDAITEYLNKIEDGKINSFDSCGFCEATEILSGEDADCDVCPLPSNYCGERTVHLRSKEGKTVGRYEEATEESIIQRILWLRCRVNEHFEDSEWEITD